MISKMNNTTINAKPPPYPADIDIPPFRILEWVNLPALVIEELLGDT